MTIAAQTLLASISMALDDPVRVRTPDDVLLRTLSRAQMWICLRHRLLIQPFPLTSIAGVPWVNVALALPRMLLVTDITRSDGTPLQPVPITRLRYSDSQWLSTTGTPSRYYRIGWVYVGYYPVPTTGEQMQLTGVVMPRPLLTVAQVLEIPDSYSAACVKVTIALLLLGRERLYQDGLALLQEGLSIQAPPQGAAA